MRVKKTIERPLIRANIDSSFWIKECDKGDMHVLLTRRTHIPGKPDDPIYNDWVQTFTVDEWNRLMHLKEDKNVDWMASSLVFRYRIIHDGSKAL